MQTTAYFNNIADYIIKELNKAEQSIYIAVAWFTNLDLFKILLDKARNGVTVQVLVSNDEINQNSRINFSSLKMGNSAAYLIGNGKDDLMHNKFCVIDHSVVITGSYNWSIKAERNNHENIVVTKDDFELANQFIVQFKQIRDIYFFHQDKQDFPVDKVIKRLEILKNYVLLEDKEDIARESRKLIEFDFQYDVAKIISALKQNSFNTAVELIEQFIHGHRQVAIYTDIELSGLKLEIRHLQYQVNAYDDEKTELERVLIQFQNRHSKELGEYISKLLYLRKLKAVSEKDKAKILEAEQDEREYNEQLAEEVKKAILELSGKERQELKRSYKKASVLCHPDKVSEELKELAEETFNRLKQSYEANDLIAVNNILVDLQQGKFAKRAETVNEKDILKSEIQKLKSKITQLENDIFSIKESKEYKSIAQINDWDTYFADIRIQLINEIERFEIELSE